MNKDIFLLQSIVPKVFKIICVPLFIITQFHLSGCATPSAMDIAKRNAPLKDVVPVKMRGNPYRHSGMWMM